LWISELFPEVAAHADELCLVRSMHTDLPAHPQAYLMMHTGNSQLVRPSLGAWTLYGLGTENENLPGFVAIKPVARNGGPQNYGSAFLRPSTRGPASATRSCLSPTPARQHQEPPARPRLAAAPARPRPVHEPELLDQKQVHPGVEGVIESYELAFRMQNSIPR